MLDDLEIFDDSYVEINDSSFRLSYSIFLKHFEDQFLKISKSDNSFGPITFKSKTFQQYVEEFYKEHADILSSRSNLIREFFLLNHTTRALYRFNVEQIRLVDGIFNSTYYYPNVVYLLIRYLVELRQFLQKQIKSAFLEICKTNQKLIFLQETNFNIDVDVIKTDILYRFLGNSIRKINPLSIEKVGNFFRQVFKNHFVYYLKQEMKISKPIDNWSVDISTYRNATSRDSLYKDVLTNLQVENYRDISPTMRQLHYNYQIFRNVIISNEFQSIFLTSKNDSTSSLNLNNSQYKILSFYDQMMHDEKFLTELKKIPLIYKLLKSVHLITKKQSSVRGSKKEMIISILEEELALPFKNLLNSDLSLRSVFTQIAENFTNSILMGEYISLQTLAPINIEQTTFLVQLRKFIKLCLNFQ